MNIDFKKWGGSYVEMKVKDRHGEYISTIKISKDILDKYWECYEVYESYGSNLIYSEFSKDIKMCIDKALGNSRRLFHTGDLNSIRLHGFSKEDIWVVIG